MSNFFIEKVTTILSSLPLPANSTISDPYPEPLAESSLSNFTPLTTGEVHDLIKKSPIKSCPLDPIPTDLFKASLPTLLPALTEIVNLSLQTGCFPSSLRHAQLYPILKKANLDPETPKNYRPISNFTYLSKLVERAVTAQLTKYMTSNNLFKPLQSAYRPNHSTETAIITVLNDLLTALDSKKSVLLSLLDCSAAFDLVSHSTLLHRLNH